MSRPLGANGAYLSEKGLSGCDGFHLQIQGDPADSESPEGWQKLAGGVSHRLRWKIDLSPGRGGTRAFHNRQGVAPPGAFRYVDRLTGGSRHRLISDGPPDLHVRIKFALSKRHSPCRGAGNGVLFPVVSLRAPPPARSSDPFGITTRPDAGSGPRPGNSSSGHGMTRLQRPITSPIRA